MSALVSVVHVDKSTVRVEAASRRGKLTTELEKPPIGDTLDGEIQSSAVIVPTGSSLAGRSAITGDNAQWSSRKLVGHALESPSELGMNETSRS